MRTTIDTFCNLDDPETKRKLLAAIGSLTGMYDVSAIPRRLTRSGQQNRFYWSCVVKPLADYLNGQGEYVTTEETHELLKNKFMRRSIVNKTSGEVIGETTTSTTSLDVARMAEYLESAIQWLDEMFGIIVPDPQLFTQEQRP